MTGVARRSTALAVAVLITLAIGACSGGGSAASATPPATAEAVIDARNNVFAPAELTVAAGEPTTVFFRNLDGQPHNVAVYTDDTATTPLFVGDTITDAAIVYEVPALESGTWFFRCDVHPSMTGAVTAEEPA